MPLPPDRKQSRIEKTATGSHFPNNMRLEIFHNRIDLHIQHHQFQFNGEDKNYLYKTINKLLKFIILSCITHQNFQTDVSKLYRRPNISNNKLANV